MNCHSHYCPASNVEQTCRRRAKDGNAIKETDFVAVWRERPVQIILIKPTCIVYEELSQFEYVFVNVIGKFVSPYDKIFTRMLIVSKAVGC